MKKPLMLMLTALALTASTPPPALTEQQAAGGLWKQDDIKAPIKPAAQRYFDAARRAAGDDFIDALRLCNNARPEGMKWDLPRAEPRADTAPPEPLRVFDNLYFLRTANVTAWAVATEGGIILIDTLNNGKDAEQIIEGGLRKFGLDPATIRYIIVSHGHGDHYGGAAYLQRKYGARVMMSDIDWTLSPTTLDKPYFDPAPPRDLVITDGQSLTLGRTTLRLYLTPGHTLGTTSVLIPVTDHGQPHMVALWAGTGYNFPHSPERFGIYSNSAQRFMRFALAAGADAPLGNHAAYDTGRLAARLAARGPNDPHPLVYGTAGVRRFLQTFSNCALAYGAQMQNPPTIIPPAGKAAE